MKQFSRSVFFFIVLQKALNYTLIYGVAVPLSWLPMGLLHGISRCIAWILFHVIRYRINVVRENLAHSFPSLTNEKKTQLIADIYLHLADMIVETIKMLSISRKEVMKRYVFENPEIMTSYQEQYQSVIWTSGHHNNWEFMVLSLGMQTSLHGVGVGKRLSNQILGTILHRLRTRYGTEVVYADNVRSVMERHHAQHNTCVYMLLADQSPNDRHKCYRTSFLNQDSGIIYGPEYFAKKYNFPVLFYKVKKIKRGYYSFRVETITNTPQLTPYGFIMERYTKLMEMAILENPAQWLWSHRRWKHQRPQEIQ